MPYLKKNKMKLLVLFFVAFIISCNVSESEKSQNKTIAILPYKGISQQEVDTIASTLQNFYHLKTVQFPFKEIPKKSFVHIKSPRYRADSLIKMQQNEKSKSANYILGLTNKDISVTKRNVDGTIKKPTYKYSDFGIMGLAYCPGETAVISTFRLKNSNKTLQLERFKKVVIHEFGHNLGLKHCTDKKCVMTSANETISSIDNEKLALCGKCNDLIK